MKELRFQSGKSIKVTDHEWEVLSDLVKQTECLIEAYVRLPEDAKENVLHWLAHRG